MKPYKVGITFGAFDLCHAGHMLMFQEAKEICQFLIVGLHTDPSVERPEKNKPIMSVEERHIILQSIKYIDAIEEYDTEADLLEILDRIQPDVRIIGADWQGKNYTGKDKPLPVYFNDRGHKFSTSELRRRVYEAEKTKGR